MKTQKRNYILLASHLSFWIIPTFLMIYFKIVTFGRELNQPEAYLPFLANVLLNVILVYLNLGVFFPAYIRGKIGKLNYTTLLVLQIPLWTLLKVGINLLFFLTLQGYQETRTTFQGYFILEIIIVIFFLIQSVLYSLVKEWFKNRMVNLRLNEEKLSLELKYLKMQINPHFLFNTLNNLFSMALRNNDEDTANGISKLSQIMRYMLTDVNEKEIPLDKEIAYLKSYVELQKLRFSESDDIRITFVTKGNTSPIKIPPFLFIVFIENAFKYGIDYTQPSFIDIEIKAENHKLAFNICNSIHESPGTQKQGIGLVNIRERLSMLFPKNHTLTIFDRHQTYEVNLEILLPS